MRMTDLTPGEKALAERMGESGQRTVTAFQGVAAAAKELEFSMRAVGEVFAENREELLLLQEAEMEKRASPRWRYVILVVAMTLAAIVAVVLL
jgi:cobalamin biosynthesis Mg chelatase CobN